MKVYVVTYAYSYSQDSFHVEGVYATEKQAQDVIASNENQPSTCCWEYEEFEVQK